MTTKKSHATTSPNFITSYHQGHTGLPHMCRALRRQTIAPPLCTGETSFQISQIPKATTVVGYSFTINQPWWNRKVAFPVHHSYKNKKNKEKFQILLIGSPGNIATEKTNCPHFARRRFSNGKTLKERQNVAEIKNWIV